MIYINKLKLTAENLVVHMKKKGIEFNYITEEDAINFLQKNNYYYKFAAYRHNFLKKPDKTYLNLDFLHLKELSTLDMYIREILLNMTLDIEHYLKVILLNNIEKNKREDGYRIVKKYFYKKDSLYYNKKGDTLKKLYNRSHKKSGSYNKNILNKYKGRDIPIWVLVELLMFNDLIWIIDLYQKEYPREKIINHKVLNNVRDIRNACAHNNCLIYNLKSSNNFDTKQPAEIYKFIYEILGREENFTKSSIRSRMKNTIIFDICAVLYVYDNVITSKPIKTITYNNIKKFMDNRMIYRKDLFNENEHIIKAYKFFKKIIDYLIEYDNINIQIEKE